MNIHINFILRKMYFFGSNCDFFEKNVGKKYYGL